jgi:hypothetical protein
MDVSRIEAISPKQIEWRKLTAPEIIEYKEQGVDVPSQYLQWAQAFLNDVNAADTDETTYETANSQTVAPSAESAGTTTESSDAAVAEGEEGTEIQEEPKSPAEAKREDMEANGASLVDIAKVFIHDSRDSRNDALRSAFTMAVTGHQSENEIQALDNHMRALLKHAEAVQSELKNEVQSINDGDNDPTAIGKINKLNAQLQRMGMQAQSNLAGVEGDLSSKESFVNSQSSIILNAEDFGTETIGVGNDLLASVRGNGTFDLKELVYGLMSKRFGAHAVFASKQASNVQGATTEKISEGQSTVQNYIGEVQNKTGVESISLKNDAENQSSEENKSSNDPAKNPTAEIDKAASADLDQILKAKIRKGENVGNDQSS